MAVIQHSSSLFARILKFRNSEIELNSSNSDVWYARADFTWLIKGLGFKKDVFCMHSTFRVVPGEVIGRKDEERTEIKTVNFSAFYSALISNSTVFWTRTGASEQTKSTTPETYFTSS